MAEPILDIDGKWPAIGVELGRIQCEWQAAPARDLLAKLIALGAEATELMAVMPDDRVPLRDLLEQGLGALRARLLEAVSGEKMPWLSSDDLEGIAARLATSLSWDGRWRPAKTS